jgi:hypothetical protein
MIPFHFFPGERVRHRKTGKTGTVCARARVSPGSVAVRYDDGRELVSPYGRLELIPADEPVVFQEPIEIES